MLHVAATYPPAAIWDAVLKKIFSPVLPASILAISPLEPTRSQALSKVNVVPSATVGVNVTTSLSPVLERMAYSPSSAVPVPLAIKRNVGCAPPGLQAVAKGVTDVVVVVVVVVVGDVVVVVVGDVVVVVVVVGDVVVVVVVVGDVVVVVVVVGDVVVVVVVLGEVVVVVVVVVYVVGEVVVYVVVVV
jgi:hypothetical protein